MNYELAKQLRLAGFSQKGSGDRLREVPDFEYSKAVSIEELIEACGFQIYELQHKGTIWDAIGENCHVAQCSTPTEAIARLWLALNSIPQDSK